MANTDALTNFHIIGREHNDNSTTTPTTSQSLSSTSTAHDSFGSIPSPLSSPPQQGLPLFTISPQPSSSSLLLLQQQQQPPSSQSSQSPHSQPTQQQQQPPLPPPINSPQRNNQIDFFAGVTPPSTAPPKLNPATRSAATICVSVQKPFTINRSGSFGNDDDDDDDDDDEYDTNSHYGTKSEKILRVFDASSSSIFPDTKNNADDVISDVINNDVKTNESTTTTTTNNNNNNNTNNNNNNNGVYRAGKKPTVTSMSAMNLPSEGGPRQFDRAYLYRNSSVNDLRRLENLSCMLGQAEVIDDEDDDYYDDDGDDDDNDYYYDNNGDYKSDYRSVAGENSESGCARPRGFLAGGRSLSGSSITSLGSNNSNRHSHKFRAQGVVYKRDGHGPDGNNTPKIYRERYVIGRVIGEGSYAKVKEAFDLNNHCTVAIKVFSLRKLRRIPLGVSSMNRELKTFRKLIPHFSVVSLVDYWRDDTKDKNYLAMTYAPCGTLKSLIDRAPDHKIPLPQARRLFLCIVQGLSHLHHQGIYHRDLKTDNFMLLSEYSLCITDFGTATFDPSTEGIGAPAFQPPEVALTGRAPSSAKLDIWAAGITLFVMVTGTYPFDDSGTVYQLFEDIGRCDIAFPDDLPEDLLELLKGMLKPDPEMRWSLEEIARAEWVTKKEECLLPVPALKIRTVFTSEYVQQLVNPDGVHLKGDSGDDSKLLDGSSKKNKCCIIL